MLVLYPFWMRLLLELVRTWFTKVFWARRENLFYGTSLAFSGLFWTGIIVGVVTGPAPLLGWMISAYFAVWLAAIMTWRVYKRTFASRVRHRPAMLLLQLVVMIIANTAVIIIMLSQKRSFHQADLPIAIAGVTGLLITAWLKRLGRLPWDSGWMLCGYAVSLKSAPQVVQAWALYAGQAALPLWSAVSLLVSGASRWVLSLMIYRENLEDSNAKAQVWNAGIDLATVILIQFGVVMGG